MTPRHGMHPVESSADRFLAKQKRRGPHGKAPDGSGRRDRQEALAHREARQNAREDRAQHDPWIALLRATRADRGSKPNPAMEEAAAIFQRVLEAEAKARKGGRPKAPHFGGRDKEIRT